MPIKITTELIERLRPVGVGAFYDDHEEQIALEYALIDAAAEALTLRRVLVKIRGAQKRFTPLADILSEAEWELVRGIWIDAADEAKK